VEAKYVTFVKIYGSPQFKSPERPKPKIKMSTINYKKPKKIVKKVKQSLGVKRNDEVGEKTFDYYVNLEEIEDE